MIKLKFLVAISFCMCVSSIACMAQPFEQTTDNLLSLYGGPIKWVDLDNDADLDIMYCGFEENANSFYTRVYENTGGTFALKNTAFPDITNGAFAFGDYDLDGDLDILISGRTSVGNISELFENTGSFAFVLKFSFPGLINSQVSWFDIDNDNDVDFILAGVDDNAPGPDPFVMKTLVYENDGSSFTEIETGLPQCGQCAMDWADANGDGKTDVIMTGFGISDVGQTNLFLNLGDKTFEKDERSAFNNVSNGDVKWGDFDVDGDLDLLLSGVESDGSISSTVYENRSGIFTQRENISIYPVGENWHGGTAWVDFDNDGLLDILVSGRGTSVIELEYIFKLYKNNGSGSFEEAQDFAIDGLADSSVDYGDFDNDGDADLCFAGITPQGVSTGILKNKLLDGSPQLNSIPSPPAVSGLVERSFRKAITLQWNDGTDAETPFTALSYNIHLRNATSTIAIPTADLNSGFITAMNPHNGQGKRRLLSDIPEGQLFWSVQSVDGGKAGSPFSTEKAFYHINGPEAIKAEILDVNNIKLSWKDNSTVETSYHVTRSLDVNAGFVAVASLPQDATSYVDNESFLTNTFYYYRIYAANSTDDSPYDSLRVAIPSAPFNLASESLNASTIALTWEHESGYETGYVLERKLSSASSFEVVAMLPAETSSYSDQGLSEGTAYDYRVRAINEHGSSGFSNTTHAQTNFRPFGDNFIIETLEDDSAIFTAQHFVDVFSDPDVADQLVQIIIESLPQKGTLQQGDDAVVEGQIILVQEISQLKFVPNENENGLITFNFYTHDGKDTSAISYTVEINVVPVNDAPVISTIPDQEAEQYVTIPPITLTVADVDDPPESIVLSGTSSNQTLISDLDISFEGTTAQGSISLSPEPGQTGEAIITISASDGKETVSTQFKLTVSPVTAIEETSQNGLVVYPNPFVSGITIMMDKPANSDCTITLCDATGRIVARQYSDDPVNTVDLQGVGSGMYLLTVSGAKGDILFKRKVVKK